LLARSVSPIIDGGICRAQPRTLFSFAFIVVVVRICVAHLLEAPVHTEERMRTQEYSRTHIVKHLLPLDAPDFYANASTVSKPFERILDTSFSGTPHINCIPPFTRLRERARSNCSASTPLSHSFFFAESFPYNVLDVVAVLAVMASSAIPPRGIATSHPVSL
ncbi:hypothetical protein C8R45DRAFT_1160465, partial [Mycena sanguinolenta]